MMNKRIIISIYLLVFTLFTFSQVSYAQDDTIRVDTDLITIPVTVLDREGRYIANLKKENFQISEDGIEQETTLFESVEKPITVFFLLDRSGSMSNYMEDLARAANVFVKQLHSNDQIIVATFADNVDVSVKRTKVIDLGKGIKLRQNRNDTNTIIYDAVDYAFKQMNKLRGRKAIILFSDGGGDGVFASFKSNMRKAEESDTLVYTVQFDTFPRVISSEVNKKAYVKSIEVANIYMKNLAQLTGGRAYQIDKITNLEEKFKMVADELSQQYSLGYYPAKEAGKVGERRQIKVKINIPNAAVRARDSYVVGNAKK